MNKYSWLQIFVGIIVIAACIGIVIVALNQFDVDIPDWAVTMFWILVVACAAIAGIKLLWSMFSGGPSNPA